MSKKRILLIAWVQVMSVCICGTPAPGAMPLVETIDMNGSGDNADDMCLWLHPTDPSRSVILGSNKSEDGNGGVYSFDLSGGRSGGAASWGVGTWFDQEKKINNVDVSYNFQAGAEKWDIVTAANRTDDRVDMFRVATGVGGDFAGLVSVGSISTSVLGGDNPYGTTLFHSKSLNTHYLIASSKNGQTAQWELSYNAGAVTGSKVWQADLTGGSEVEGIVADHEKEVVYIASENTALYRYQTIGGVIQDAGRVTVDTAGGGHLTACIEGLAIYYAPDGAGYLIASSQGSSQFAVYSRQFTGGDANAHILDFTIGQNAGLGIDAVSGTDGVDVTGADLGGAFDDGMFLAHDTSNSGGSISNVKLVDWADVADETIPALIIDTGWDRRSVPDPATASLLALGALALLRRRRDRL